MEEKTRNLIVKAAEYSGEALSKAVEGYILGGFPGAGIKVAGSVSKNLSKEIFKNGMESVLSDLVDRNLSERERTRVGYCSLHAMNKIFDRIIAGETPRSDGFMSANHSGSSQRSEADVLFEAVLRSAKGDYEEKKIPYISNIYAGAVFSKHSFEALHTILRVAEKASWRQLCLLALLHRVSNEVFGKGYDERMAFLERMSDDHPQHPIVGKSRYLEYQAFDEEIREMGESLFLIFPKERNRGGEFPSETWLGEECAEIMELSSMPESDYAAYATVFLEEEYKHDRPRELSISGRARELIDSSILSSGRLFVGNEQIQAGGKTLASSEQDLLFSEYIDALKYLRENKLVSNIGDGVYRLTTLGYRCYEVLLVESDKT